MLRDFEVKNDHTSRDNTATTTTTTTSPTSANGGGGGGGDTGGSVKGKGVDSNLELEQHDHADDIHSRRTRRQIQTSSLKLFVFIKSTMFKS